MAMACGYGAGVSPGGRGAGPPWLPAGGARPAEKPPRPTPEAPPGGLPLRRTVPGRLRGESDLTRTTAPARPRDRVGNGRAGWTGRPPPTGSDAGECGGGKREGTEISRRIRSGAGFRCAGGTRTSKPTRHDITSSSFRGKWPFGATATKAAPMGIVDGRRPEVGGVSVRKIEARYTASSFTPARLGRAAPIALARSLTLACNGHFPRCAGEDAFE